MLLIRLMVSSRIVISQRKSYVASMQTIFRIRSRSGTLKKLHLIAAITKAMEAVVVIRNIVMELMKAIATSMTIIWRTSRKTIIAAISIHVTRSFIITIASLITL